MTNILPGRYIRRPAPNLLAAISVALRDAFGANPNADLRWLKPLLDKLDRIGRR